MALTEEKKVENFKRLAQKRTEKILGDIRILGHCSSRYTYSYTEEDVNKIFTSIELALAKIKQEFLKPAPEKDKFKL